MNKKEQKKYSVKEALTDIMSKEKTNAAELARELQKTPENIYISLKKGNPSVRILSRWLKPLKATLVIKHKNKYYEL